MKGRRIGDERMLRGSKVKALFLLALSLFVASSLVVYAIFAGEIGYSLVLVLLATVILGLFAFFAIRRFRDASQGIPFEDERSRRVMEKAGSRTFLISLYVLLAIGWLSEDIVHFRDVSQATGAAIGVLALAFFGWWFYFNRKEI